MATTDDWSRATYQTTYRLAYNNHSPEQFQERVPWPLKIFEAFKELLRAQMTIQYCNKNNNDNIIKAA